MRRNGALRLFARQELSLALRSRWTQIFAAVFAVLSVTVAASGYALSGGHGVQDFARTSASLVQLALLVIPLMGLTVGVQALAPERGAAELVFSQPVARRTVLLGKLLGLFQGLAAAQALGFGLAGLVVFSQSGGDGAGRFLVLVTGSLIVTAVFLSIAALLAATSIGRRRARAMALALVVWFVSVALFDIAALGVATMLTSGAASRLLAAAAIVNPIGAARTATLLALDGTTAFGGASLAFFRATGGTVRAAAALATSLIFWIAAPGALAIHRLNRVDL